MLFCCNPCLRLSRATQSGRSQSVFLSCRSSTVLSFRSNSTLAHNALTGQCAARITSSSSGDRMQSERDAGKRWRGCRSMMIMSSASWMHVPTAARPQSPWPARSVSSGGGPQPAWADCRNVVCAAPHRLCRLILPAAGRANTAGTAAAGTASRARARHVRRVRRRAWSWAYSCKFTKKNSTAVDTKFNGY